MTNFVFVLNGWIFLLIGLQLPAIAAQLGDIHLGTAIGYGLVISLVLILTRLAFTLGASVFTTFMSRFITVADPNPGWKLPFIHGWAGMRGVVSLAAALSIPLLLSNGEPFPYRNLILFITFIVILVTLVFQGLTLPWIIRKLNAEDKYATIPEPEQEIIIQKNLANYSLRYLKEKYGQDWLENAHLSNLYARLRIELGFFKQQLEETGNATEETDTTTENTNALVHYQQIYLELLDEQRTFLHDINRHAEFDEDLIRKYHSLIDIEELKTRGKL